MRGLLLGDGSDDQLTEALALLYRCQQG